jgi:hypothetical protein
MTTYIAGPMTGLPDYNYPAFNAAAAKLRAEGVDVRNPAELNDLDEVHADPKPWDWYVRRAIRALLDCDEILLLPGWEQSKGAQLERHIAEALGMKVTDRAASAAVSC